jgi:hypothetical protein
MSVAFTPDFSNADREAKIPKSVGEICDSEPQYFPKGVLAPFTR